jgi:hypothetical protein
MNTLTVIIVKESSHLFLERISKNSNEIGSICGAFGKKTFCGVYVTSNATLKRSLNCVRFFYVDCEWIGGDLNSFNLVLMLLNPIYLN